MAKIYVQSMPKVWELTTSSLISSGSITSGSFISDGYARLVGIIVSSGSGANGTTDVRIRQSVNRGQNWDHTTSCTLSACSGTSFSVEVVGDAMDISYYGDTTANTDEIRTLWMLRPI
jgi:hypothetical protein